MSAETSVTVDICIRGCRYNQYSLYPVLTLNEAFCLKIINVTFDTWEYLRTLMSMAHAESCVQSLSLVIIWALKESLNCSCENSKQFDSLNCMLCVR